MRSKIKIGIVGPCAAGKSTLITRLRSIGYDAHHIAQEHSYVADMWQRLTRPDLLVYLDVSYTIALQRRNLNWTEEEYREQVHRLRHAREYADFFLKTDDLSIPAVLEKVLAFVDQASAGKPGSETAEIPPVKND